MNENFIEEENTIYEIDPNCQIEKRKSEVGDWKHQSCTDDRFPVCRRKEERMDCRENRRNGNGMCCFLLLILLFCNRNW